MTLTYKDFITTLLAATTTGFAYLMTTGYKFPIISGYRAGIVVLLAIGIAMCAFGSRVTEGVWSGPWVVTASVLGIAALVVAIVGLVTGTKVMFLTLAGIMVTLWVVATLRHLIGA
jgi:hypothetical protein